MRRIACLVVLVSLAALPSLALAGDPAGFDQYSENPPSADGKKSKQEKKSSDPALGPAPAEPAVIDEAAATSSTGKSTSKGDRQRKAKEAKREKKSRPSRNMTEPPEVVTLAASSDGGGGIGLGILLLMGASLVLAAGIGVARHRGDMTEGSKSE